MHLLHCRSRGQCSFMLKRLFALEVARSREIWKYSNLFTQLNQTVTRMWRMSPLVARCTVIFTLWALLKREIWSLTLMWKLSCITVAYKACGRPLNFEFQLSTSSMVDFQLYLHPGGYAHHPGHPGDMHTTQDILEDMHITQDILEDMHTTQDVHLG